MDIATYLETHGKTAVEFAKMIGVTRQQVYRLINGKRKPSGPLALEIEQRTGGRVTRHELRPDLYPSEAA